MHCTLSFAALCLGCCGSFGMWRKVTLWRNLTRASVPEEKHTAVLAALWAVPPHPKELLQPRGDPTAIPSPRPPPPPPPASALPIAGCWDRATAHLPHTSPSSVGAKPTPCLVLIFSHYLALIKMYFAEFNMRHQMTQRIKCLIY